jgi:hypothetical protein
LDAHSLDGMSLQPSAQACATHDQAHGWTRRNAMSKKSLSIAVALAALVSFGAAPVAPAFAHETGVVHKHKIKKAKKVHAHTQAQRDVTPHVRLNLNPFDRSYRPGSTSVPRGARASQTDQERATTRQLNMEALRRG